MFALLLTACSMIEGPHTALQQAEDAFARHDLAAFEQAVDLDAIAPAAFQLCFAGATRKNALEREFTGGNALTDIVPALGDAFVLAASQQGGTEIAAQIRKDFATLNLSERCPEVQLGRPSQSALFTARRSGSLMLPASIAGIPVEVPLTFAEVNGQWRLTGMNAEPTLKSIDAAIAAEAHRRAMELIDRVRKGGDPASWAGLRHYAARHPEDAEVARAYEAAVAPLLAAETPVGVSGPRVEQAGLLGMKRRVAAAVRNEGDKDITQFTVRFELLDSQGRPVTATTGGDAVLAEAGALARGQQDEVELMLQALNYPGVAQVRGTVVKASFADGSTWTHPAVDAGLW